MRNLIRTSVLLAAALFSAPAAAQPARETPIEGGLRTPIPRAATEQRERGAGVAADADRETRELRDLNALSRQLAPDAPPPAPEAERRQKAR